MPHLSWAFAVTPPHQHGDMDFHTAQPTGTATPTIDWEVIAVFDPDEAGSDFAYTIGLTAHGLPEAHIWARPPAGQDPGDDWILSARDRTAILNRLGIDLICGRRQVGDTWSEEMDGGFTTMHFRLEGPFEAEELDAFGASPAPVLALRWELERPVPPDEPVAMPTDTVALLEADAERIRTAGPARRVVWGFGDSATAVEDPELDAALGDDLRPAARILAQVRGVLRSHSSLVDILLGAVPQAGVTRAMGATCQAAARMTGRVEAVVAAERAAMADAHQIVDRAAEDEDDSDEWREAAVQFIATHLAVAYAAWLLRDVLDDAQFGGATGWVAAIVDPAAAHERFDTTFGPAHLETVLRVPPASDDDLRDRLYDGLVQAAIEGLGAPLLDGDELAWCRLVAAGILAV